jgi:NAD(P)-dependent dehydrogenase (short-subunit alcohol dehydrogenase family)
MNRFHAPDYLMLQSVKVPSERSERESSQMGKLNGKTAVITAATSGMALATAKRFVEEGAYVFITGRNRERLDRAIKEIGRNVTGVQADSSKLVDLDKLYATVKKEKGKIDILFASAGEGSFASVEEVTEAHFDSTFNTNVRGTLFTVQKALPLFNNNGSIILNGSIASIKGFPRFGVYSASKAAVRSFARTWLLELKDRGIRVNVLSPGTIDTPILEPFGDEGRRALTAAIPRGTMGRPEEIAGAATFLASDDASFVNGVELFVDGGTAQV